jgi:flagellar hook protein FlgE
MVGMTQALQGLARSEAQFNGAAQKIAQFPQVPVSQSGSAQGDQVDLSAAAVALIESRNSFNANTKMIKVADQMEQTLLNTIGPNDSTT